ncbi:hypothetical protein B296_00015860 [Ensete ventricosum]|uniref:Uncharacterized protein n=1 Tax=Ensete ventricosum TaxID=4639 RepID=A0A426Z9G6_ENSVE|nr:hypothetical protein B296_00015860 [Ensete ventricosum]
MWIQTRHDVAPARTSGRCLPPRVSAPIICVHVIRYDTERERERERERRGSDIVTRGGHVSRPLCVSLDRGDVAVDDPGHDCLSGPSRPARDLRPSCFARRAAALIDAFEIHGAAMATTVGRPRNLRVQLRMYDCLVRLPKPNMMMNYRSM